MNEAEQTRVTVPAARVFVDGQEVAIHDGSFPIDIIAAADRLAEAVERICELSQAGKDDRSDLWFINGIASRSVRDYRRIREGREG